MTFPAATMKKERLKTCATKKLIIIDNRSALDFRQLEGLGAATAEAKRLQIPIEIGDDPIKK